MGRSSVHHRLHDHHTVLQPALQGGRSQSEDGQEERRAKGARDYTGQRGRAVRCVLHLGCRARQFHACAGEVVPGGHSGYGHGVYRLRKAATHDGARRDLCHQDEEKLEIREKMDMVYPSTDTIVYSNR